jgi:hypothetical protein
MAATVSAFPVVSAKPVLAAVARHEQPHRLGPGELLKRRRPVMVGQRQGREGVPVLTRDTQDSAAGDQRRQRWAGGQQTGDDGAGIQHLLEVVEHQQRSPLAQKARHSLFDAAALDIPHPKRLRDARRDERGVAHGGEGDEPDAVREGVGGRRGHRERQAGLADAAGAGQGQQAHVVAAQQRGGVGDLALAADQRRQGPWQGWSRLARHAQAPPAVRCP